jgi:hypothetical protein
LTFYGSRLIFNEEENQMGKKTYEVNGNYYIIDDEDGSIKRLIIQDDPGIPQEDYKELIRILSKELAKKE